MGSREGWVDCRSESRSVEWYSLDLKEISGVGVRPLGICQHLRIVTGGGTGPECPLRIIVGAKSIAQVGQMKKPEPSTRRADIQRSEPGMGIRAVMRLNT